MQLQSFKYLNSLKTWRICTEKTTQTNTQLLQHLNLQSLGQVMNRKLGVLNIQQYTYCT